jgi:alkylation response protein AidB-like acyl-CoA dehydrogenase
MGMNSATANNYAAEREKILAIARELGDELKKTFRERDLRRDFPHEEMRRLRHSGLLASSVPAAWGGLDLTFEDIIEVVLLLAAGNPSVAHMYAEHAIITKDIIARLPKKDLRDALYREIMNGDTYLTAAGSERASKTVLAYETTFTPIDSGRAILINGRKFFATGAIASDFLWVPGVMKGAAASAFVRSKTTEGVRILDDWDAMGMQGTWSGSVEFKNARVPMDWVVPAATDPRTLDPEQLFGPMFQTAFTAIPLGAAKSAFNHATEYVKTRTRPWVGGGVTAATKDPYVLRDFGRMSAYLAAAEGLVRAAARSIERACQLRGEARPDEQMHARVEAMVKVAQAKVVTTDVALNVTTDVFKVCGARSALREEDMDRFLRDVRTITLHDPIEWKANLIGEYLLHGTYEYIPFFT